jgi:hypothetical protein
MSDDKKSPYGTSIAKPDAKAGVEVGGGDKAAAAIDPKARDEATRSPKSKPVDPESK